MLIDADVKRGRLERLFEAVSPAKTSPQATQVEGLSLVTKPGSPADLEIWRQDYDLVLLDTPPLLVMAEASLWAPLVDACLMVTWSGKTSAQELLEAQHRLELAGGRLEGWVLNGLSPKAVGYQAYRSYGFGAGYDAYRRA